MPPPICAETWLRRELVMLKPELIVTVGGKSFKWFFPELSYDKNLNGKTIKWNDLNVIALPHPSGANNKWKTENKERLEMIIKELRTMVKEIIGKDSIEEAHGIGICF